MLAIKNAEAGEMFALEIRNLKVLAVNKGWSPSRMALPPQDKRSVIGH